MRSHLAVQFPRLLAVTAASYARPATQPLGGITRHDGMHERLDRLRRAVLGLFARAGDGGGTIETRAVRVFPAKPVDGNE